MAHSVTIQGDVAEIKRGYLTAASIHDWKIVKEDDQLMFRGRVVQVDPLRLSQQPLRCVIPKNGWTWSVLKLQQAGESLEAVLGPLEG